MSNTPQPAGRRQNLEEQATLILGLCTLVGLILLVLGLVGVYFWWDAFSGLEQWRAQWWKIALCELGVFGGLAVMFVGLSFARAEAQNQAGLRRLLYGYNTVLTGLLLLTILVHLNLMAYLPFAPFKYANATYDWTESGTNSVSPASAEFIRKVDKPVMVYVVLPGGMQFLRREMTVLLSNFHEINPRIKSEELSPDATPDEVARLEQQYGLQELEGVLIVYGTPPDEKSEFIKMTDLIENTVGRGPDEKPRLGFKGESALITRLAYLMENKANPVVYFTQGNGELDLNDLAARQDDKGLGQLRQLLERGNYTVKELHLAPAEADRVPEDASVVVVAGPTRRLPDMAVKALHEYMVPPPEPAKSEGEGAKPAKKVKGKLIVLLDVAGDQQGKMVETGLEPLLAEFNVQAGNGRIVCALNPVSNSPLDVVVVPASNNPVADKLRGAIVMRDVRPVEPQQQRNPTAPSSYRTEKVLEADPGFGIWVETDLNKDVALEVQDLRKQSHRAELVQRASKSPLTVAVAVSESLTPANPMDPHAFMQQGEQQPRMLVFGDTTWVSNRRMGPGGQFELFSASLAWLRERPDIGIITAKERKPFLLSTRGADDKSGKEKVLTPDDLWWRLVLLPVMLVSLGIVGLGAGVWIVRRR